MKTIASALIALSLLAGIAAPASAACTMDHWPDGAGAPPTWKCK